MDYKQIFSYFESKNVLFATNGDKSRTPSIEWSMDTYRKVAKNIYRVPGNIYGKDCFENILKYASDGSFGYVIYVDADCFICDYQNLVLLFDEFSLGGYAFGGMPDGGCVPIRKHNKYWINPFFSMFNVEKCKENLEIPDDRKRIFTLDRNNMKNLDYTLERCPKGGISISNIDDFEPYYLLFSKLSLKGNSIMYMLADEFKCGLDPSTGIYVGEIGDENLVCVHSWYARVKNKKNMERIRKLYRISQDMTRNSCRPWCPGDASSS